MFEPRGKFLRRLGAFDCSRMYGRSSALRTHSGFPSIILLLLQRQHQARFAAWTVPRVLQAQRTTVRLGDLAA